jgi:hypothetical protein
MLFARFVSECGGIRAHNKFPVSEGSEAVSFTRPDPLDKKSVVCQVESQSFRNYAQAV